MNDRTGILLKKYIDNNIIMKTCPQRNYRKTIIKYTENELGTKFPEEYIAHLFGKFSGMILELKFNILMEDGIGAILHMPSLYGFHTFTLSNDEGENPINLDITFNAREFSNEYKIKLVPILEMNNPTYPGIYCINKLGKLVYFDKIFLKTNVLKITFWELLKNKLQELNLYKNLKIKEYNLS
jgi:hypothetical protein